VAVTEEVAGWVLRVWVLRAGARRRTIVNALNPGAAPGPLRPTPTCCMVVRRQQEEEDGLLSGSTMAAPSSSAAGGLWPSLLAVGDSAGGLHLWHVSTSKHKPLFRAGRAHDTPSGSPAAACSPKVVAVLRLDLSHRWGCKACGIHCILCKPLILRLWLAAQQLANHPNALLSTRRLLVPTTGHHSSLLTSALYPRLLPRSVVWCCVMV
jgi:hypothetical protein